MTTRTVTAQELRRRWRNREEVALLDVREEGPYAESHPLFALTVPVSEIQIKLPSLVPRLSAPIVVYDDGEGYVARAVACIQSLGYADVSILEGGLSSYARVGEVYRDVNVPSKAFGELVEAIQHTPSLPAPQVEQVLKDEDVVVLDVRRYEEYNTMSIPRGRSCPGGELLHRVYEAAPSPDTTIVVHCAGRTRGLIGTQTLLNAGIPNKVFALRNGTIGWTLEGLSLENRKMERVPQPSTEASAKSRMAAQAWAEHVGIVVINDDQLEKLAAEQDRTLHLLDVRDPEEYALGHLPGFASAPGGQLVQATDEWVGVRGARLVLNDDDGVRARITATWLHQLGWEVYVLEHDARNGGGVNIASRIPQWTASETGAITVSDLTQLKEEPTIIDLARSPKYRKGHIPGAWHASGPELARDVQQVGGNGPIVLTSPDGHVAAINAEYARHGTSRQVYYLLGGTEAWVSAGRPLQTDIAKWLSEPIDIYDRPYEGTSSTREAMEGYIEWEHQLVAQLANDGVSCFHVVRRPSS